MFIRIERTDKITFSCDTDHLCYSWNFNLAGSEIEYIPNLQAQPCRPVVAPQEEHREWTEMVSWLMVIILRKDCALEAPG